MATTTNLTFKEFGRRYRKALSVPFLLNKVCSNNVQEFVTNYAESLGCTDKCFFFPLLSCAAACMGTESFLELTAHWQEPPIIWTLVVTQKSLLRIDVVEHLKQQLLLAQNEAWVLGKNEDTKDHLKKFLFDIFTLSQLQDMLKLSNGHGLILYNSVRSLHKNLLSPEDADIMLRLHSGLSWFNDSRVSRSTVGKTRVNYSIVSSPSTVHQTLTAAPNFQELFHQCFLTICAEENHVKFGQISDTSNADNLREIFVSLLKLHFTNGPIVYKLSSEAKEKFSQIHDELTDKAKQMARKSAHKVFQPALSYLARLSCVLHVLDNVIDAINYKVPITRLTWNTEINANTVWMARELLGHIIEQRHALMEQTMLDSSQTKINQPPSINLADGQAPTQQFHNSPRTNSPRTAISPISNGLSIQNSSPRFLLNSTNRVPYQSARRNLMNNRGNSVGGSVLSTHSQQIPNPAPIITAVHSAGLPVSSEPPSFNPIISNIETVNNNLNSDLNIPPALSISVSEDQDLSPPLLLSRTPFTSIMDVPEQEFLSSHRSSIRKLLKHAVGEITPSRCVQLKMTPDPTASDDTQKYTSSFARSFLKRLEKLGFGICDGPKKGNLRNFTFKKKKFSGLGDEQIKILENLKISEVEYNKCFTAASGKDKNGKVVCLE